ncbi:hypothetical protein [Gallaecimonas xiamenensis]|nr:hypothetical protein [Gallaecimonas xiamenensis]
MRRGLLLLPAMLLTACQGISTAESGRADQLARQTVVYQAATQGDQRNYCDARTTPAATAHCNSALSPYTDKLLNWKLARLEAGRSERLERLCRHKVQQPDGRVSNKRLYLCIVDTQALLSQTRHFPQGEKTFKAYIRDAYMVEEGALLYCRRHQLADKGAQQACLKEARKASLQYFALKYASPLAAADFQARCEQQPLGRFSSNGDELAGVFFDYSRLYQCGRALERNSQGGQAGAALH